MSGSCAKNKQKQRRAWAAAKNIVFTPADPRTSPGATQNSSASFSPWGSTCNYLVDLPFLRRIAARHDPPSFLPAPPACQSPVTSRHGRSPGGASAFSVRVRRLTAGGEELMEKRSCHSDGCSDTHEYYFSR